MIPTIVGDVAAVQLGPGGWFVAPLGTANPTSASGALNAAYVEVGWTEDGGEFAYELTTEDVYVAELFDPIKVATTSRKASFSIQLAETNRRNLALALNAGAGAGNTAQGLSAPAVGSEVRTQWVWEGDNGQRWDFRQCFQSAAITIKRAKAPAKSLIPVTYKLELPTTAVAAPPVGSNGRELFWVFPTATGQI
jgi:hypothetical protein